MGRKKTRPAKKRIGPCGEVKRRMAGGYVWRVSYYDTAGRYRTFAEGVEQAHDIADGEMELAVDRFLHKYPDAVEPGKAGGK